MVVLPVLAGGEWRHFKQKGIKRGLLTYKARPYRVEERLRHFHVSAYKIQLAMD
jgi:hypothetical protein